jgi:UDP-N-acetylglucosamine 2-epimerase (non-hydrolysing)
LYKILLVFGTRPEAIKMSPLVKSLQKEKNFKIKVCVTAQHREMLDQVLEFFEIKPDYDLNIMLKEQNLFTLTSSILLKMKDVLEDFQPNLLLVQGDTTTSFSASLCAYYKQIKVGHIEAGLRTNNLYSPWPEEANRQMNTVLANYHFAPTALNKNLLLLENKNPSSIVITGNTVIDALFLALKKIKKDKKLQEKIVFSIQKYLKKTDFFLNKSKFILVTGHRRENHGDKFIEICKALYDIAQKNPQIDIVYPVHLNPNIQKPVYEILHNVKNIYLIPPLSYEEFIYLLEKSYFVLTDSGGIQEEAPSLGKPVLVMRDTTERTEAIEAKTVKLVGTSKKNIVKETQKLLDDIDEYKLMSKASNPYGNGDACSKIVDFLKGTI